LDLFLRQAFGNFSLLFKVVENGKGVDVLDSVVVARVHVDARETKPVGHVNRVVVLDSRHFGGFVAVWMSGC